jgi:hypothetical protein
MKEESFKKFNNLLKNTKCSSNYKCVQSISDAPCVAQVYAEANLLDCIECKADYCEYLVHYSTVRICHCPLRKMIAVNYQAIFE